MADLVGFRPAIKILHRGLAGLAHPWAITGSLGFALQGMDTAVHDIDLQSNRDGALAIEAALQAYSVRPVRFSEAERIRSFFGALSVAGVQVEIMGDIQKRLPGGEWQAPVELPTIIRWADYEGMRLPVLDLEYEHQAYLALGRLEKARQLRDWLDRRDGG